MKKKRRVLLLKTKIGEFLTIEVEQERDEIDLFLASADVSASFVPLNLRSGRIL